MDEREDRPKTLSLALAVQEVKYWCGVNMIRLTYDWESIKKLLIACAEFEKTNAGRLEL